MVDKIVKFKNKQEYLILEETFLDNVTYYLGVKVLDDDVPTSEYLFFEKIEKNKDTILNPIKDKELRGLLLTSFNKSNITGVILHRAITFGL